MSLPETKFVTLSEIWTVMVSLRSGKRVLTSHVSSTDLWVWWLPPLLSSTSFPMSGSLASNGTSTTCSLLLTHSTSSLPWFSLSSRWSGGGDLTLITFGLLMPSTTGLTLTHGTLPLSTGSGRSYCWPILHNTATTPTLLMITLLPSWWQTLSLVSPLLSSRLSGLTVSTFGTLRLNSLLEELLTNPRTTYGDTSVLSDPLLELGTTILLLSAEKPRNPSSWLITALNRLRRLLRITCSTSE